MSDNSRLFNGLVQNSAVDPTTKRKNRRRQRLQILRHRGDFKRRTPAPAAAGVHLSLIGRPPFSERRPVMMIMPPPERISRCADAALNPA
jgi:hypothetical protein